MRHFLLKLTFFMTFILSVMGLAARSFGSIQPLKTTMREFRDACESVLNPCWLGIIPGTTTVETAKGILMNKGYTVERITEMQLAAFHEDGCQNMLLVSSGIVRQINLTLCPPLLLGDFIEQSDFPDTIMLDPLSIWYKGQMQLLFVPDFTVWDTVSYYTPLQAVVLFPTDSPLPYQRAAWLDVLTQRKYCQLKGLTYHCAS